MYKSLFSKVLDNLIKKYSNTNTDISRKSLQIISHDILYCNR